MDREGAGDQRGGRQGRLRSDRLRLPARHRAAPHGRHRDLSGFRLGTVPPDGAGDAGEQGRSEGDARGPVHVERDSTLVGHQRGPGP